MSTPQSYHNIVCSRISKINKSYIEIEKHFIYKYNNVILSKLFYYNTETSKTETKIDYYKNKCVNCIFDIPSDVIQRAMELIYSTDEYHYSDAIYHRYCLCKLMLFGYSVHNLTKEKDIIMEKKLNDIFIMYINILENDTKYKHLFVEEYDTDELYYNDEYLNNMGKILDDERDL